MYKLLERLFPITRSITGNGVRETLKILKEYIPLVKYEIPSGRKVFDWVVPDEWNINDAFVMDEKNNRIIDYNKLNLHVVGYSIPFEGTLTLDELKDHLYTLPDQPTLVPYVTSYYEKRWGFCISHNQYKRLKNQKYFVKIDSTLKPGSLTYGEFVIPGKSKKEIFFSTYICHPSMANNELSGPVVSTFLAKSILDKKTQPNYTYRFLFVPETIGSIAYIDKNLNYLKKNMLAGYVVTCVGDPGKFSYLKTKPGNLLADKVAFHLLKHIGKEYKIYDYLERGSDERQYNSPGVDLPVGSLMRTKHRSYPEYHTSADNLQFVKTDALIQSLSMYRKLVDVFEVNHTYKNNIICEPKLDKYGLYPKISKKNNSNSKRTLIDILAYSDGHLSLLDIAEKINRPIWEIYPLVKKLEKHNLVKKLIEN